MVASWCKGCTGLLVCAMPGCAEGTSLESEEFFPSIKHQYSNKMLLVRGCDTSTKGTHQMLPKTLPMDLGSGDQ